MPKNFLQGDKAHRLFEFLITQPGLIGAVPLNDYASPTYVKDRSHNFLLGTPNGGLDYGVPMVTRTTARQFTAANSEYFTVADNTTFSMGDVYMAGEVWVQFDSLPSGGAVFGILAKYTSAGNQVEWGVYYSDVRDQFEFSVSPDGTGAASAFAGSGAAAVVNTWYRIKFYHDPLANVIGIGVNNGAFVTQAYTGGIFNGTAAFTIGRIDGGSYLDGRIGPVKIWKGKVPSSDEWEDLYRGKEWAYSYTQLSASLKSYLVEAFDMDAASGNEIGEVAGIVLTDTNTVTTKPGLIRIEPYDARGLFVDASGDYVDFGDQDDLDFEPFEPFSGLALVVPTQKATGKMVFCGKYASLGWRWYIDHSSATDWFHAFQLTDGTTFATWFGDQLVEGQQQQIGFAYDGLGLVSSLKLYSQGVVDTMANAAAIPVFSTKSAATFQIGANNAAELFKGDMGQVYLFNKLKDATFFRRAAEIAGLR